MQKRIFRLLIGLMTGLAGAGLVVWLAATSQAGQPAGVTLAALGGPGRLLLLGGLLGIAFALLYRPQMGAFSDDIMNGVVLGIVASILLANNLPPILRGDVPMWEVGFASEILPWLVAFVLQGVFVGLIYGRLYRWLSLADRPPAAAKIRSNIVIIGGGYAGVSAAESLEAALAGDPSVAVWLVSKTNYLVHTPMLSEVSASAVSAQNISPPLRSFFRRVRVVQGVVDTVDWDGGQVILQPSIRTSQRHIPFEHLIVTAGGEPNYFGNQAIAANTFPFKSLGDSIRLRNHVIDMFERADFEQDTVVKQRMLTFIVVGGGFAGVELIGGLNDFGRGMLSNYPNLGQEELRFLLIHTRGVILPELSPELGRFAQEKMVARGVEFRLNTRMTGARPGLCILGDEAIASETVVWTAGNRPSPVNGKLGVELNSRGQIPVAATMRSAERTNLWAAGDCAAIPDPQSDGRFYPPTAQHALRQGKHLGKNVAAVLQARAPQPFIFRSVGSLAVLGHQLAVAEIFGRRFSGFLAWLMWRAIYLSKLPSFEKQLRVLLDWTLDIFFPPDIVQTTAFSEAETGDGPSP